MTNSFTPAYRRRDGFAETPSALSAGPIADPGFHRMAIPVPPKNKNGAKIIPPHSLVGVVFREIAVEPSPTGHIKSTNTDDH